MTAPSTSTRPSAGLWHRYGVPGTPPPRRSWHADVVGTAFAMSMLVVVALWVRHGGVQALGAGWPSASTTVGRLTGLAAADLLLIQVLLMARVPWIERAYGADRLARWHRWVGFTSVDLMLVHVVLITIGYAGSPGGTGVVREAWDLVTTYPGMLLATAATVLLVGVAVTSMRAARRRLRYESWHLLHLYAYLGVGLALPHEIWTGADFMTSTAVAVYWWTVYAAAAGAVLVCRVGVPAWLNLYHRLEVAGVATEAPGIVSVYIRGRHLDRLGVRAGQFLRWRFLDGPGWTRANPYSLSAAPRPDLLRITVKDLGDGSHRLAALRPGTRVLIEGAQGNLTRELRRSHKVTLIAAGVGITPIRALLEDLPFAPGHAVLIYRARTPHDFAFRAEIEALATARGVRVCYLPGPRASDASWLPAGYRTGRNADAEALRRLVRDIAQHDVYVCGPDPWMEAVIRAARVSGVPRERIHSERFSW